ncbi:hypothetical protein BH10BAC5_BH10BAC5_25740 [soil metagenome]
MSQLSSPEIEESLLTIGRDKQNDIVFDFADVSRKHATILRKNAKTYIKDHNSTNCTFVNGKNIKFSEINECDDILIGKYKLNMKHFPNLFIQKDRSFESSSTTFYGKIDGTTTTIGRSAGCDIRIDHPMISRNHAVLTKAGTEYFIEDAGSLNGVYVNAKRISARTNVSNLGKDLEYLLDLK